MLEAMPGMTGLMKSYFMFVIISHYEIYVPNGGLQTVKQRKYVINLSHEQGYDRLHRLFIKHILNLKLCFSTCTLVATV